MLRKAKSELHGHAVTGADRARRARRRAWSPASIALRHARSRRPDARPGGSGRRSVARFPVDVAVRQVRPGVAPVAETALRIPGGEVGAPRVRGQRERWRSRRRGRERVAGGHRGRLLGATGVRSGSSCSRDAQAPKSPTARLVFPVPHRQRARVRTRARRNSTFASCPDADAVERAWATLLDRGMTTELPQPLQQQVDAARADLLLAPIVGCDVRRARSLGLRRRGRGDVAPAGIPGAAIGATQGD